MAQGGALDASTATRLTIRTVETRASVFAWLLYTIGFLARILPLVDERRLFWQFPTEDGYLMLTIARNLALGKGMSTADGLISTNGTQPLFTFLEALGFWLAGGDRSFGVRFALLMGFGFALLGAGWLERCVQVVLADRSFGSTVARMAGALWFAAPIMLNHSMNCLETGLVATLGIATMGLWLRMVALCGESQVPALTQALWLGACAGLTFWARIDAIFLIGSLTLLNLFRAQGAARTVFRVRLIESCVIGGTSALMASPWLAYNKLRFGHFMPISGLAQGMRRLGGNLDGVPSKLFEYASLVLPVPHRVEGKAWVIALTSAIVLAYGVCVVVLIRRARGIERMALGVAVVHVAALVAYYGLFFGAKYFLSRYFAPVFAYTVVITLVLLVAASESKMWWSRAVMPSFMSVVVLLCCALHVRTYAGGTQHMHRPVVHWVAQNVPERAWVAAVQTGTLGFFHDRTINLDGKVNPEALEAQRSGRVQQYLVDKRLGAEKAQVEYLVDWYGIREWQHLPPMREHFELVLADPAQNLAAFARK